MDGVLHALLNIINTRDEDDTYYQIALILINHIDRLAQMSITQIADLCFISTSTLSRFFRDIGFRSFSAFKECLDRHYGFEIDYTEDYLSEKKTPQKKMKELQAQELNNLKEISDQLDQNDLIDLVKWIHDSPRVVFFGYSFYQYIILYLQQRLSLFRKTIMVKTETEGQIKMVKNLDKDTLAVLFSPRGQSMVTNGLVNDLYKKKIKTVLITMNDTPPFAQRYEKIIYLGGSAENNMGIISLLFLVDQIIQLYYTYYKNDLIV